jgi:hypothetical protein
MRAAGPHSLAAGDLHIHAVAVADGDLGIPGVVAAGEGMESGRGSGRSSGHTGPGEGRRSRAAGSAGAAGTSRGAVLGSPFRKSARVFVCAWA